MLIFLLGCCIAVQGEIGNRGVGGGRGVGWMGETGRDTERHRERQEEEYFSSKQKVGLSQRSAPKGVTGQRKWQARYTGSNSKFEEKSSPNTNEQEGGTVRLQKVQK